MAIEAVIFDLDGTITQPYFDFDAMREEIGLAKDSGPILESMEKRTLAPLKLDALDAEFFNNIFSNA